MKLLEASLWDLLSPFVTRRTTEDEGHRVKDAEWPSISHEGGKLFELARHLFVSFAGILLGDFFHSPLCYLFVSGLAGLMSPPRYMGQDETKSDMKGGDTYI